MKNYSFDEYQKLFHIDMAKDIKVFSLINEHIRVCVFNDGEKIVNSHEELDRLYLLHSGKAKVTIVHENGKNTIVHFMRSEDLIGELTLLGIEKQHKDVYSIGTSICLSVPMDIARSKLLKDNTFLIYMSRYIGNKLLNRTWFSTKQQRYDLKHRLAAYILLCERDGVYSEKHVQTADYLGVSYRHLLYTFRQLLEEGLLTKSEIGYRINVKELEILASVLE